MCIFTDLKLELLGNVRIVNFEHKEDLISGSDELKFDQDRRNVFTDRTKKNLLTDQHIWTLEKVPGKILLFDYFSFQE